MRWLTPPKRVAEAQPDLGRRVHAGADLVGHDDEREAALGNEVRERVGRGEDGLLFVAAQEEIGDPERQAVEDHDVRPGPRDSGRPPPRRRAPRGAPARGSLGAVARDPRLHVAVEGLGRGEECSARVPVDIAGGDPQGLSALAASDASEDEIGSMHATHPGPPAKTGWRVVARAGLLALGSSYSPRLPGPGYTASGANVGFVPDYSDGVAADSHRLPWDPHPAGRPDTVSVATVAEAGAAGQPGPSSPTGKREAP